MNGYIKKIRSKLGKEKIIHPGARIIIENEHKEILFIERMDNGNIGIPAGAFEENETIEECIIREVREETGLELIDVEVIGISTNPKRETVEYWNGDKTQYFTVEFYSDNWKGKIKINDKDEIKKAQFMPVNFIKQLPENELSTFESLKYYRRTGKILMK